MMAGLFESYSSGSHASRWFLAGVGKKTNHKGHQEHKESPAGFIFLCALCDLCAPCGL
jgi:hypothetical protein